ncbi:MAG: hypothetical protein HY856_13570 [Burkholderiales bacterium]|nr:hypothetical protein [Burkholderiales bacterium]
MATAMPGRPNMGIQPVPKAPRTNVQAAVQAAIPKSPSPNMSTGQPVRQPSGPTMGIGQPAQRPSAPTMSTGMPPAPRPQGPTMGAGMPPAPQGGGMATNGMVRPPSQQQGPTMGIGMPAQPRGALSTNGMVPAPQGPTMSAQGGALSQPGGPTMTAQGPNVPTPRVPGPQQPGSGLPGWANDPSQANLNDMAGEMEKAATYTPGEDALVSEQLNRLLAKDSDYMQLARTKALQSGASRGLLNSSMTASAGELAAIQSALPIAQQDAQSFFTSQRDNAAAQNDFASQANEFSRQGALARFQGTLDQAKQERDLGFAREELGYRDRWTNRDLDLRSDQLKADSQYRQDQLNLSRDELAQRDRQFNDQLGLDRDRLEADQGYRDRQLDLSERELGDRADQAEQQARTALQEDIRQIRQQAIDAQRAIETDQKMSAAAKARAIEAIHQNAAYNIQEIVMFSGLDMPEAWPDWINTEWGSGAGGEPPAPPPAPFDPTPDYGGG